MLHPVGPQTPSIYWRRRLFIFGGAVLLAVLVVLTAQALMSDGHSAPLAASTDTRSPAPNSHHHEKHAKTHPKSSTSHSRSSRPASPSPSTSTSAGSSSAAPPPTCKPNDLDVSAVAAKPSYQVGQQPVLDLQVVNAGSGPCVQDLADQQVELRVYNGESRVWGSHDCKIEPGTTDRVLPVGRAVRVTITWSGLSSRPGCAGTRQRVGAGTYTLYALLSGHMGKATTFALT